MSKVVGFEHEGDEKLGEVSVLAQGGNWTLVKRPRKGKEDRKREREYDEEFPVFVNTNNTKFRNHKVGEVSMVAQGSVKESAQGGNWTLFKSPRKVKEDRKRERYYDEVLMNTNNTKDREEKVGEVSVVAQGGIKELATGGYGTLVKSPRKVAEDRNRERDDDEVLMKTNNTKDMDEKVGEVSVVAQGGIKELATGGYWTLVKSPTKVKEDRKRENKSLLRQEREVMMRKKKFGKVQLKVRDVKELAQRVNRTLIKSTGFVKNDKKKERENLIRQEREVMNMNTFGQVQLKVADTKSKPPTTFSVDFDAQPLAEKNREKRVSVYDFSFDDDNNPTQKIQYDCLLCGLKFVSIQNKNKHVLTCHSSTLKTTQVLEDNDEFNLNTLEKTWHGSSNKFKKENLVQVEPSTTRYPCAIKDCMSVLTRHDSLLRHLRSCHKMTKTDPLYPKKSRFFANIDDLVNDVIDIDHKGLERNTVKGKKGNHNNLEQMTEPEDEPVLASTNIQQEKQNFMFAEEIENHQELKTFKKPTYISDEFKDVLRSTFKDVPGKPTTKIIEDKAKHCEKLHGFWLNFIDANNSRALAADAVRKFLEGTRKTTRAHLDPDKIIILSTLIKPNSLITKKSLGIILNLEGLMKTRLLALLG